MILFKQTDYDSQKVEIELADPDLKKALQKTRRALEIAYAGFNNATDFDMIDSYIFEINSLQQKYKHLSALARREGSSEPPLHKHSSILAGIAHIFG